MTLILTRASKAYVLQVTDRLVTGRQKPFDELANKNILYCAKNAIVAMAYTGLAFLGDIPTDQWIVEVLTGHKFDRGRKPPALSYASTRPLDLGRSLELLREALDTPPVATEWRDWWIASSFDVCIEGWQWGRRPARPIIAWVSKSARSTTFELGHAPRYWHWDRSLGVFSGRHGFKFTVGVAPSDNMSLSELQTLRDRLGDRSPDEAERVLVEAIREVSRRLPEVGPHCMSILIAPPSAAQARVRIVPLTEHRALVETTSQTRQLTVAFCPWLVGPKMIVAPSVLSGHSEVQLGPYTVALEGPEEPGLPQLFSGQPRPKAP